MIRYVGKRKHTDSKSAKQDIRLVWEFQDKLCLPKFLMETFSYCCVAHKTESEHYSLSMRKRSKKWHRTLQPASAQTFRHLHEKFWVKTQMFRMGNISLLYFPLCGPSIATEIQLVKAVRVIFLYWNRFYAEVLQFSFSPKQKILGAGRRLSCLSSNCPVTILHKRSKSSTDEKSLKITAFPLQFPLPNVFASHSPITWC